MQKTPEGCRQICRRWTAAYPRGLSPVGVIFTHTHTHTHTSHLIAQEKIFGNICQKKFTSLPKTKAVGPANGNVTFEVRRSKLIRGTALDIENTFYMNGENTFYTKSVTVKRPVPIECVLYLERVLYIVCVLSQLRDLSSISTPIMTHPRSRERYVPASSKV